MTDAVQPDIIYVRKDRTLSQRRNIVAAPDRVVEILSDTISKTDIASVVLPDFSPNPSEILEK